MSEDLNSFFANFLVRVFKPAAALCLSRGVKVQTAVEALKSAFVDAACEELAGSKRSLSVSRLAVMSGLHRRDVARRVEGEKPAAVKYSPGLLTRVIGQWQQDRRFCSRRGRPRALSFKGGEGEFVELVKSVSKDLNPYTLLFELERTRTVERSRDRVKLITDVYVPSGDVAGGLSLLCEDSEDLMLAVGENIFSRPQVPNLHIRTQYDNVAIKDLARIKDWFLQKGAEFHDQARRFLSQFDKDLNPRLYDKEGGARVVVGTFSRVQTSKKTEKGAAWKP